MIFLIKSFEFITWAGTVSLFSRIMTSSVKENIFGIWGNGSRYDWPWQNIPSGCFEILKCIE